MKRYILDFGWLSHKMKKKYSKRRFRCKRHGDSFLETDQQIEIFKVFEKSGNGSKIWGNGPKIWGNRSPNWDF